MSKNKMINYRHLKRLLISQPYFVWHNNSSLLNEYIENEIEDNDTTSIWDLDLDLELEIEKLEFAEVVKTGFGLVERKFIEAIEKQANDEGAKVAIISEKNLELAFSKTMEALNDSTIDWIVNPVFIYEDLIAKPKIYKKNSFTISSLVYSSKTKLLDYVQAYFEYNVLKKMKILCLQYTFYNFNKKYTYTKAKDLKFEESEYCWISKNGPSSKSTKPINEVVKEKIILKIKSGKICIDDNKTIAFVYEFDEYIKKIRDSSKARITKINNSDLTIWGENPLFLQLFNFEKYKIPHVSGNLLNKKNLLEIINEEKTISDFEKTKKTLKYVLNQENHIDYDQIKELVIKIRNSRCVWYDFEGFSMPYTILPYTKPYQQIVFQVSVIKTSRSFYSNSENVNIVIDPSKLNYLNFMQIIDSIYDANFDFYVVYNKAYENTRLKEMVENLNHYLDEETYAIYKNKVDTIIENTIDLNDMFKVTSSKVDLPPLFLYKLNGYSSIKKIEKYITTNKIKLPIMIKPYENLEIKNGLMAMNSAIQRFLETIGDLEWEAISTKLAEYCENDVKAMIMVFHFIEEISNKTITI